MCPNGRRPDPRPTCRGNKTRQPRATSWPYIFVQPDWHSGLHGLDHNEDSDVLDNVAARGAELEPGLNALAQRYHHVADVRGREPLWGLEFVLDRKIRTPPPVGFNASGRFVERCTAADLIVYPAGIAPDNIARLISPPLVITKDEVDILLQRINNGLAEMEKQIRALT